LQTRIRHEKRRWLVMNIRISQYTAQHCHRRGPAARGVIKSSRLDFEDQPAS